jgi:7-carboxy-7-deazaguanine synthase
MQICEIFASIQGESTYAGLPCVFVRLSGCNLRCSYCDTLFAYEGGTVMSPDEVITDVSKYGIGLVEITGGEPLCHTETVSLAGRFLDMGFRVLVETNGTIDISGLDQRVIVIMDVKTPGSGEGDSFLTRNFDFMKKEDELKFVITDRADYEWAVETVGRYNLGEKCTLLFSPASGRLSAAELGGWIIADRLPVRLNLQMHKFIYGADMRGV